MPEDCMSLDNFTARLDEFSNYDLKIYCRACRKILLKYGVSNWNEISEMKLGKVYKDLKKELIKRTHTNGSLRGVC